MKWIKGVACAELLFAEVPTTASAHRAMRWDLGAATDSLIAIYRVRLDLMEEKIPEYRRVQAEIEEQCQSRMRQHRPGR